MSNANATTSAPENEITIYGYITDFEGLLKADKVIYQEQYELKPAKKEGAPDKGKIRVRKETINGQDRYELTTKVTAASENMTSNKEYTIEIDREYFDAFKSIANSGMIKTRYVFPIKSVSVGANDEGKGAASFSKPEACFEVDVFSLPNGKRARWCKIDLELDEVSRLALANQTDDTQLKITANVSDLPFKPTMSFIGSKATAKENAILDVLFKEVFLVKM